MNMGAYCSVQDRSTSKTPPYRRTVKRWPTKGKAPGGQGIFINGECLSSTNLYTSHKMGSKNIDKSRISQLKNPFRVCKIIIPELIQWEGLTIRHDWQSNFTTYWGRVGEYITSLKPFCEPKPMIKIFKIKFYSFKFYKFFILKISACRCLKPA